MRNLYVAFAILILLYSSHAVKTGDLCTIDDDCPVLHNCLQTGPDLKTCVHKPLFPITAREVIATLVTVTLNAFLTAGGVGAGAAFVPYVILLFRTTLSHAIYIAYLVVFGGGLGNLINIIGLKNPKTNRYMTNYNLNMIILPALMTGVMIGMILQRIFPPLITHIILLLTLAYALKKNYGKLKINLAKERKEREAKKQALKTEMARINPAAIESINPLPERTSNQSETEKESIKCPEQEKPIVSSEKPDTVEAEPTKEPVQETLQEKIYGLGQETKQQIVQERKQGAVVQLEPIQGPMPEAQEAAKKSSSIDKIDKPEDMSVVTTVPADKGSSKVLNVIIKPSEINLAQLQEAETIKEQDIPRDQLEERRKHIYEKEQKYPFRKIIEISANVVVIILIGLIRGSKTFRPIVGVDWSCGWDFIWFGIAIAAYSLILFRALYLVLKWQKEKMEVGYEFLPEEPYMNRSKIIRLVIVATIAGTIGAIVALGGSMIVGPTLLDFGMPPAFSAATTGFFMIFAMFNTTFSSILNKKVSSQELYWFLPLAFVFSFMSSKLVNWYVKKTGKQSTIIKCIMLVAALGFVCLLAIMIMDLVEDTKAQIKFTNVC